MTKKDIAGIAHEINRAYCEVIGDPIQPDWKYAPDWMVESAIDGVEFHLKNKDAWPGASHENWLAEKERTGWVYGPIKDAEKKEHPCMVAFEDLPKEQQIKDSLFMAVVHSLIPFLDE